MVFTDPLDMYQALVDERDRVVARLAVSHAASELFPRTRRRGLLRALLRWHRTPQQPHTHAADADGALLRLPPIG